jgi:hypothetical protein
LPRRREPPPVMDQETIRKAAERLAKAAPEPARR